MKTPDIKDFTLTFETAGTTILFEDLNRDAYMPADSLSIYENGTVRAYISKEKIEEMHSIGEKSSVEKTKEVIQNMSELVKDMGAELESYAKKEDFDAKDIAYMFDQLKKTAEEYEYFDFNYWDTVFENSKRNSEFLENIKLIEGYKNTIRAKLGPIYFDENDYMGTLLKKVSEHTKIAKDDLSWYLEKEIFDLYEKQQIVSLEIIEERKKLFVMWKDAMGKSYFFDKKEAEKFIQDFGKKNIDMEIKMIQGKTAHTIGKNVQGKVRIITMNYRDGDSVTKIMDLMQQGEILVSETTSPELMDAIRKAGAIVTDVGGLLSHAAITARELNIPCIVNTGNASKIFKDGDMVEVDTEKGMVRKI